MSFTVEEVIEQLGYEQPDDLVSSGDEVALSRRQAWIEARDRLNVDAAFFQGGAPLVYFRGLSVPGSHEVEAAVREFHRRAWNHNRAPFLIVVLPDEIRVLDGLSAPFDEHELGRAPAGATVAEALAEFSRLSVVSGALASKLRTLPRRGVVEVLRANLASTRSSLVSEGLSVSVANALLGRSLFVQYLDDRNVLAVADTASFAEALEGPPEGVYGLFANVYARFNGDVFPVTPEETAAVTSKHLSLVGDFVRGARDGQLPLFPYYDFSVIPAELLSNVCEEFLGNHQRDSASYYTPGYLVDLVLDEVLPPSNEGTPATLLDPACGSGTFIARAYRRLIDLEASRRSRELSPPELAELLSKSLFGCDIVPSAVRVAAFSCYLVLLDHCSDEDVAAGVKFPRLLGKNLLEGDFFALMGEFDRPFDLIVSNPPWKSTLTDAAHAYVDDRQLPVGDNQIAQAFFWACAERAGEHGRVGLLMPSKSALYGHSRPNIKFRRAALSDTHLDLVIDFSAFRHTVFQDAVGPMAVFVLRARAKSQREHVTFCTPRPSPLSESAGRVILSGDEIKRVPRSEAIRRPDFWKAALFGTMRDVTLVEALRRRFPLLREIEKERGWTVGSGFQVGGGEERQSRLLQESRFVPAVDIEAFCIDSPLSERIGAQAFHRVRSEALFRGPHLLIRRGIDPDGRIRAAFLKGDAVFKNSVVGVAAPASEAETLEILTAIVNSDLARYYLYLTSSSWGIERPALEPSDLRNLPIAIPARASESWTLLLGLSRRAAKNGGSAQVMRGINSAVFKAYDLSRMERSLVADLVRFGIDQHHRGLRSAAYEYPTGRAFETYRRLFEERLAQALGVDASASLQEDGSPFAAVSVGFGEEPSAEVLNELRGALGHNPDPGAVVLHRTVRVYRRRGIDMAKPAEARYWTRAAAIQDVDDIVEECLRSSQPQDILAA